MQTRRRPRRLNASDRNIVVRRYQDGESLTQIADSYQIAKSTVSGLLKREGIETRRQITPEDKVTQAVLLYEEGMSLKCVAQELAISHETVRYQLTKRGVPIRPSNRASSSSLSPSS